MFSATLWNQSESRSDLRNCDMLNLSQRFQDDLRTNTAHEVGDMYVLTGQVTVWLNVPPRRPAASKSSRKPKIWSIPVKVSAAVFSVLLCAVDVTQVKSTMNAQFLRVCRIR